ncbi:uncharacterized protein LOC111881760 [Lactuca sativa]|uniref:Retrotransposon gag domain-containing protein n=1 Tax=Lactuca sativa TaxID=4236 RepID=A0A9R1UPK6_LACSA|nr:uncharacterized protein LOC111881760 [Lactuca sativa]KAJ0191360.1 hypothetical protein LSAT_V11C800434520 [Lactuca sativa]
MSVPIKSSTIATAISCKLTRINFLLWKAQGTDDLARESPNPDYDTWAIQDHAVIGGILSLMTKEVIPQLIRCINTTKELWTSLHTMFSAQHRGNSIQICTQLSATRKGDMSATEYYQKMTGFANTMANISQLMGYEEVVGYTLPDLGLGHNGFFTTITALSNEQKVTLPEFYSYLIAYEAQATSVSTTLEYTSSSDNATRHESNAPRCNKNNGHNNSNKRNNYRGGSRRVRGRNNGGVQNNIRIDFSYHIRLRV